ncbi:MAG: PSD1 and planctomycete cytochrome C domain-containing protein [Pirellulales bacterium]|nr:PSD1 and planctomycete cytochrome C domain-containing protein [Pirellulales bacterium]
MLNFSRQYVGIAFALCAIQSLTLVARAEELAAESLTFEQHIRPIFKAYCFDCHGATDEKQAHLDLRLVRFQLAGGDSGPALAPGQPDESHLVQRLRSGEMPPGEVKVPADQLAMLERWIAAGAKTANAEPESLPPGIGITAEDRTWWAFLPLHRPRVPAVPERANLRTPIDALLAAEMPPDVSFAPDADRLTLLKRACFDLTGLPPAAELVARFTSDDAPDAYERLIDELLASPHYGERWARHWLDVAGYADSEGATTSDAPRSWAFKYRDYVIRSLNADKPLDRFIDEQLAGDELAGPVSGDLTSEQIELLTATGFLQMAADGTGSGDDSPEARNQVMADTLKIVSSSLLGLTVACAQCHDHRYDPISQVDYYALRAVFEPALDPLAWRPPQARHVSLYTTADRQRSAELDTEAQAIAAVRDQKQSEYMTAALEQELTKFEEPLRGELRTAYQTPADQRTDRQKQLLDANPSVNLSPGVLYQYNQAAADDLKAYDARIAAVLARKRPEEFIRALTEPAGHAPQTLLFHRGDYRSPKQPVAAAAPAILCRSEASTALADAAPGLPSTGRRLALSRWLTGPENPITARVLANRIWLHHFGRGLVATPGDFGRLGARPTHPALLDWLAVELRDGGWSLKRLHRTIMLSTAYRQSSRREPGEMARDPENRWYARKNVVRLEAETLRDRMLAASGQLDPTLYGPAIPVVEDDAGQVIVDPAQRRRSLYIEQRRSRPVALLQAFDAPVMQTNCEVRPSSTVATQSLMLLNGQFAQDQAGALAQAVLAQPNPDLPTELAGAVTAENCPSLGLGRVVQAWQQAYCRRPATDELAAAASFLRRQTDYLSEHAESLAAGQSAEHQALTNLCQVLLSSNEFLYVD